MLLEIQYYIVIYLVFTYFYMGWYGNIIVYADILYCPTPSMVWYGMVWYGMVWYDMVWYGMVWYGMVWYGMVWYGMVW